MKQEKSALIITGGRVYVGNISLPKCDMTIAADYGIYTAAALGARPTLLVGDMDSVPSLPSWYTGEVIKLPCEKDDTDTQYAVKAALKRGAKKIYIIGGLSGRADHTFSSAFILEYINDKGGEGIICDGQSRIRFLCGGQSAYVSKGEYKYFGMIAIDKKCTGVCIKGAKYPLDGATVHRAAQFVVSNQATAARAKISIARGRAFLIESNDEKPE